MYRYRRSIAVGVQKARMVEVREGSHFQGTEDPLLTNRPQSLVGASYVVETVVTVARFPSVASVSVANKKRFPDKLTLPQ